MSVRYLARHRWGKSLPRTVSHEIWLPAISRWSLKAERQGTESTPLPVPYCHGCCLLCYSNQVYRSSAGLHHVEALSYIPSQIPRVTQVQTASFAKWIFNTVHITLWIEYEGQANINTLLQYWRIRPEWNVFLANSKLEILCILWEQWKLLTKTREIWQI